MKNKALSDLTILAVESSTKACSVSLLHQGVNYTQFEIAPQQHANLMLGMVETVLKQAALAPEKIDFLALCEGPGAFTGVRIAAGVIQGLAYGWEKPVVSVSSLEALAWQAYQQSGSEKDQKIIACLDARMNELYLQTCKVEAGVFYSNPPQMLGLEKAENVIQQANIDVGIGDIAEEFPAISSLFKNWQEAYPSAEYVAQIATQRKDEAKLLSEEIPLPLYLRNNVAVKKGVQK